MSGRVPKRPFATDGGPIVLAHRGWRGYYPENTLWSMIWAEHLPIDGLELDIHSTMDGELVVIHDDTVDRTTNGNGRVQDYTLAELQKLDAGYNFSKDDGQTFPFRGSGMRTPTVEEVFRRFPHLWINIDIKQKSPSIVKPFADLIRDYRMEEQMCVGSFDNETVAAFRKEIPEVVTAGSANEVRQMVALNWLRLDALYRGKGLNFQIPEREGRIQIVTQRFIEACHRRNTAVHVWTINQITDMARLLNLGVDGIVTDYPDRALELLGRVDQSYVYDRASLVFVREGKVLLMRRFKDGRTYYILPGGGVEAGETVEAAAFREAKEETNFDITHPIKLGVGQPNPYFRDHVFLVTRFSGDLQLGGPEAEQQNDSDRYDFEWFPLEAAWQKPLYPSQIDLAALREMLT